MTPMEQMFHAALTEQQRKTVQAALTLLEPGSDLEITGEDVEEALKAFVRPQGPPPRVEHIPMLLNPGDTTPIGFGTIAGDRMFIQVNNALIVDGVARLATIGDITELYLGMGFPVSSQAAATGSALSEKDISDALGLDSSEVRAILADTP